MQNEGFPFVVWGSGGWACVCVAAAVAVVHSLPLGKAFDCDFRASAFDVKRRGKWRVQNQKLRASCRVRVVLRGRGSTSEVVEVHVAWKSARHFGCRKVLLRETHWQSCVQDVESADSMARACANRTLCQLCHIAVLRGRRTPSDDVQRSLAPLSSKLFKLLGTFAFLTCDAPRCFP